MAKFVHGSAFLIRCRFTETPRRSYQEKLVIVVVVCSAHLSDFSLVGLFRSVLSSFYLSVYRNVHFIIETLQQLFLFCIFYEYVCIWERTRSKTHNFCSREYTRQHLSIPPKVLTTFYPRSTMYGRWPRVICQSLWESRSSNANGLGFWLQSNSFD